MASRLQEWTERKLEIARRLNTGEAGASCAESYLVISAVLSGIASDLWPGERIDQKRFIELWHRYAPQELGADLISLPLLIQQLDAETKFEEAEILRTTHPGAFHPLGGSLVITKNDVDRSDAEVIRLCPTLNVRKIRQMSYAAIFYRELRSSFTHEYSAGAGAATYPMARIGSGVSYTNVLRFGSSTSDDVQGAEIDDDEVIVNEHETHREIHFEVDWLIGLVRGIAQNAESDWRKQPIVVPEKWWIEG